MRITKPQNQNSRRKGNDDEAVMPLINIVFLLLIFFMIAGKLSAADPFEISPPASSSSVNAETGPLTLLVGQNGELALNGDVLEEKDLQAELSARLAADPDLVLRIKADGGAKATDVIEIMEIIRDAGSQELNLLTLPEES